MGKYDHFFWNSGPMNWFASRVSSLNAWLWRKQYGPKD